MWLNTTIQYEQISKQSVTRLHYWEENRIHRRHETLNQRNKSDN